MVNKRLIGWKKSAFDFVKGLSAAALRDCKVGFVAYNDGICAVLPPGTAYISLMDELAGGGELPQWIKKYLLECYIVDEY